MIRLTIHHSVLTRLLTALLCVLLGACSSEREGEPDDTRAGEIDLQLEISVLGSDYSQRLSATRATFQDDFVTAASEYEDLHHLRVIIVRDDDLTIVHNRGILFDGSVPVADNLRFRLLCDTDYTVYLLGNCEGFDDLIDFGISTLPVNSVYTPGLIEEAILYCTQDNVMIDNTGDDKVYLPMTEKFSVHTDTYTGALAQSQFEHFFITRAVSKFGFTFRPSEDFAGDDLPAITSIRLTGLADMDFLLPNSAVYSPDKDSPSGNKEQGREIISFNTPDQTTLGAHTFTLPTPLNIIAGMEAWSWSPAIYFAESPLTDQGLTCTISYDNGTEWLVPVQLPNLPYGLPRNTSVRVDITIGNHNTFIVQAVVEPWTTITSGFDYADEVNIATDGALALVPGTFKSLDKTTGRVIFNDNQSAISGTFGIATPVGLPWNAYLITENGVTDAIRFKLPDGSTSTHISGIINTDTKAQFQIIPTVEPGDKPNTAILMVVVTTSDGRSIPANILNGAGYGADVQFLTIIQNPK